MKSRNRRVSRLGQRLHLFGGLSEHYEEPHPQIHGCELVPIYLPISLLISFHTPLLFRYLP